MIEQLSTSGHFLFIVVLACIIVFVAMLIDLAGGLYKAKQRGEIRSSFGLKRSVGKFIMYEGSMLIACGIDLLMHLSKLLQIVHLYKLYGIPVITCLLGIFLLIIEIVSVFEKADEKTKTEMSRTAKIAASMVSKQDLADILKEIKDNNNIKQNDGNNTTK